MIALRYLILYFYIR